MDCPVLLAAHTQVTLEGFTAFSWSAFIPNGKGKKKKKKDQGIAAYKQLRAQDLGVKHGSTLDTVTNPFAGPHILLPAPALTTLACNHLFPLLLALGTGWLAL